MRFEQTGNTNSGEELQAWRSTAAQQARRTWPDAVAFREAVQSPPTALDEPDLRHAGVALDRMGMPLSYSGRFAIVFRLTTVTGERWAFRCFTSPGEDGSGATRATRYKIIAQHTARLDNTFVPFRYIDRGIKVGQEWYPALAMRWATGEPLGRWVENHMHDPDALRRVCGALSGLLGRLEDAGIAHGDWQHDNLIISEDGRVVTVVDYDGMFVPDFAGLPCPEVGHPNYQHPARSTAHFGPGLDRFACLVIETALLALAQEPALWSRFADGESLLFRKTDFQSPETSPAFAAIREVALRYHDETLAESLLRLEDACHAGADSTLLPAIEPSPAPPPLFSQQDTETRAPRPAGTGLVPLAGGKWWQIPEAAPRWYAAGTGAATTGSALSRARVAASAATQTADVYLGRLSAVESVREEQSHLWRWRVGALTFVFLACFVLYRWLFANGYPPLYFLWVANFASLGYGRWPRKRAHDELAGEITKMESLIADRNRRIAEKEAQFSRSARVRYVPGQTITEYIDEWLRETAISEVILNSLISVTTSRRLRTEAGVTTAYDLKERMRNPPDAAALPVEPDQAAALQHWYRKIEAEAAEEFRRAEAAARTRPVEVDRLRQEVAEFERHVAGLKQEQVRFPDVSFGAYFRRLAGLTDPAPTPP